MLMNESVAPESSAAAAAAPEAGATEQIVSLTEKAIEMVKSAMARESLGPDYALRVGVVGGGCSGFSYAMSFDNQPKPDDAVVEAGGIKVLIDAASREYLQGTTLDYVSGLHGSE